jgi:EAL and modified HD-GYP domain-containing signal transduction protein
MGMGQVFVARQPIFDRSLSIAGYELLFRGGPSSEALVVNHDGATARVLLNTVTEIGLERIVGPHPAWVNVTREFVLSGLVQTLPPDRIVVEVLEDQTVDSELIAALGELRGRGYRLALDDFAYSAQVDQLLPLADIIKLDLLALGRERFARHVRHLRAYDVEILAEKLETHEDHQFCAELGCDLFQGFFFRQPELISNQGITANRVSLLQVMAALQDPQIDLREIERIVSRDVALSARLLRYINSAFFGLRGEVRSIGQALALLGTDNLRRWATLSVLISVDRKPVELTVAALVRGRFCELAGPALLSAPAGELFTLGLFSVIDALMDAPMERVLATMPFAEDMRAALISGAGVRGRLLSCVTALEMGDFDRAAAILPGAGEAYLEALGWAGDVTATIADDSLAAALA